MKERRMQLTRVLVLVLVCLGLAVAGGAPSDHHISSVEIQQMLGAQ